MDGGFEAGRRDSAVGGLPYATIYPEIYNLGHRAINFTSAAALGFGKAPAFGTLSTPVFANPALRLQIYFDARNENGT